MPVRLLVKLRDAPVSVHLADLYRRLAPLYRRVVDLKLRDAPVSVRLADLLRRVAPLSLCPPHISRQREHDGLPISPIQNSGLFGRQKAADKHASKDVGN